MSFEFWFCSRSRSASLSRSVPGVLIGGQIGPVLATRVSQHVLERSLGLLLAVVRLSMLGQVVVG